MAYAAGVDVGSTQTKAVVINEERQIVSRALIDTGANVVAAAENAYTEALLNSGLEEQQIEYVVGTGYGRYRVTFGNTQVTEISCHGRGAVHMFPNTQTVLDMGGQDTKAIRVNPAGEILDFCMNDKCAAGTGRFLGAAAAALEIPLDDLGGTALRAERPVKISTTCTVFAESEIIGYLAKNKKMEDILLGMHESIAQRTVSLARRVGIEEEVSFTGGVSLNLCMVKLLGETLGTRLNVSEESHYMGAIGGALFALERALGAESQEALPQARRAAPEPVTMVA